MNLGEHPTHVRAVGGVAAAAEALVNWFERNGMRGYDPYDVYDQWPMRAARRLEGTRWHEGWKRVDSFAQRRPATTRQLLLQTRHVNSKSVGLLLAAWSRLHSIGSKTWPTQANMLIDWLEKNAHHNYPGASWSYPFGYQSRMYFPAGTPWGIVAAICGESLMDHFELTGEERSLQLAERAATFIMDGLNHTSLEAGRYISYTPLDDFGIHNANISMGALLARVGLKFNRDEWLAAAHEVLELTVSQQLSHGEFDYWIDGQSDHRHVDNYHTGFVLRALYSYSTLGFDTADDALTQGWEFYRDAFLEDDGRPVNIEGRHLPVNIHGCAESILCGATLSARFPEALKWSQDALKWTVNNLGNKDGSFGYGIFGYGTQPFAYTRWGQAWMLRAISELAAAEAVAQPHHVDPGSR